MTSIQQDQIRIEAGIDQIRAAALENAQAIFELDGALGDDPADLERLVNAIGNEGILNIVKLCVTFTCAHVVASLHGRLVDELRGG